jgi:hypothetical protein
VRLTASAIAWAAVALAPTGLAWLYYAQIGHNYDFVYANFLSVFARNDAKLGTLNRLWDTSLRLWPFFVVLWLDWKGRMPVPDEQRAALRFARIWAGAAVGGWLIFGSYYDHYGLPLALALNAWAAPAFAQRTWLTVCALASALWFGGDKVRDTMHGQGTEEQARAMARVISSQLHGGCMLEYDGAPILYKMTNACLPTRYIFPSHLSREKEHYGLGVDAVTELEQTIARKPQVVLVQTNGKQKDLNVATRTVLNRLLKQYYKPVATMPLGTRRITIFSRR